MKNKKLLFPALLPLVIMMGIGIKTMTRYIDDPADWHFIAATLGVIGFLILGVTFFRKLSKQQTAEECDATEVK